ncbi:STAS domain-containing protein [Streptomyces silvisoli]|uniref:Anti-sigma factor antagonist n=1 Tax=Streptomyces silvisoli TaxID=3034235 RepID=A0ABT5ZKI3_9ACTN|nr:STAS domain-containing protein [Streptomyces silvisoli]MDF3290201.1 STAS domain-containing protein [Streptomyces silvisoli]
MLDAFRVEVQDSGPDDCQVFVTGELDIATAPDLRMTLYSAVTTYQRISVDLSNLQFCDCAGLNALIGAVRRAQAHGCDLRLRAVPQVLARLLRLTHTRGTFTLETNP